jgi:hypothetical protein
VDDVDVRESSCEDDSIRFRHDEPHLAHRTKGQLELREDFVAVRRDGDHIVVSPESFDDEFAREDPSTGVGVKGIRDERDPKARRGVHAGRSRQVARHSR